MTRLALALATVGGVGYAPVAPGTAGSAIGVALYLLTRSWSSNGHLIAFATVVVVGLWASHLAAAHLGEEDPGSVVIDEVAGQMLTLLLLDVNAAGALLGFLLFRIMDIVKPWPAQRLEALPGGLGVMADDLMAGAYGWLALAGAVWLLPGLR
jgi:phosphatidylglycerophosphatase A